MSAQHCGCDPDCHPVPHVCERHTSDIDMTRVNKTVADIFVTAVPTKTYENMKLTNPFSEIACQNCGFQEAAHLFTSPGGVRVCPTCTYQPILLTEDGK